MSVINATVGATTDSSAVVVAKVDDGPVRVLVADNASMTGGTFHGPEPVDGQGVAKVMVTGLESGTRYWWQVEDDGTLDTSITGQLHTLPQVGSQASFTIGVASCAGSGSDFPGSGSELAPDRLSDHPVFDTIRQRAINEGWLAFAHLGDLHYYDLGSGNHGIVGGGSLSNYRTSYDDVLAQARQHRLYREVPWWYVWDDHDYGPNNSDGTFVDKANAQQVFRERAPHYPLDDSEAIYQSWRIGRVLFIASDLRSERSPNSDPDGPSKTMMGSAQKAWLADLLATSDAELLVWLTSSQWMGTSSDSWGNFATERDEIAQLFIDHGWANRMCAVYGDRHAAGIGSGAGNEWGGFPVLMAASLDSSPNDGGPDQDRFDILGSTGGRDQYGTVSVVDNGRWLTVTLSAWRGEQLLGSYQFFVGTGTVTPPDTVATVQELAPIVAGSHRVVFEAVVVDGFQTGFEPSGETLHIVGGRVTMDGTADVQTTLDLSTIGRGLFPRRKGDLLLPDGTEIFVRRGVDIGSETLWSPLGYFRVQTADQQDAPDGAIRLPGYDRMKSIIDSELLSPRQFARDRTFGSVFGELVRDVYPEAVILFDDDLESEPIGRLLIVERSRYEPLRTLAQGRGKIMRWDGEGVLRIRTAPDPEQPVWGVRAGRGGVLTTARRRITRDDVVNACVVRSQGGDDQAPARAVAIDDGPQSITRFGGRFGRVPVHISVPATTSVTQAVQAAVDTLRRRAGLPYQIEFDAVPNPALRPYDPVRVTLRDGSRERHVMERLTIPLTAEQAMSGASRESRGSRIRAVRL